MLTVGDRFPSFALTGVYGAEDEFLFEEITTANLRGLWSIIFGYPEDITFVCPTELLCYNALHSEFTERSATIYALSTDKPHSHLGWRQSRKDLGEIRYAWLADVDHDLSRRLGILVEGRCLRATYIVDPELIIRHVTVNDGSVGRNPKETLRVLDALQTGELTPCGWAKGDPTL